MNVITISDTCKEDDDTSDIAQSFQIEPIYNRHVSMLYKICFMLLWNKEDAEDAVQTVNDTRPEITTKEYDEVHSYDTIDEALQAHDLNIVIPDSELLSATQSPMVKISYVNSDLTELNFSEDFAISDGNVKLVVDCYITKDDTPFGLSTSLQADHAKASKYISLSGAEYTLLETDYEDSKQTTANIMVRYGSNQTYFYIITFTNVTRVNIEEILDSIDMSIYEAE